MQVDMAQPLEVAYDRYARLVTDALDETLAAPRHNQVDGAEDAGCQFALFLVRAGEISTRQQVGVAGFVQVAHDHHFTFGELRFRNL